MKEIFRKGAALKHKSNSTSLWTIYVLMFQFIYRILQVPYLLKVTCQILLVMTKKLSHLCFGLNCPTNVRQNETQK